MGICNSKIETRFVVQPILNDKDNLFNTSFINKNSFEFERIVGSGGFGKVNAVTLKNIYPEEWYAIKTMSKALIIEKNSIQMIQNERKLLELIGNNKNSFIVTMHHCFHDENNCYIVMDLLLGGDLRYYLKKKEYENGMKESMVKFYISCIIVAIDTLHEKDIIHRDLKPENILLDENGYCKLTDLGISEYIGGEQSYSIATSGTKVYMAPEAFHLDLKQYKTCDFFSLGIICYELLTGKRPWDETTPETRWKPDNEHIQELLLSAKNNLNNVNTIDHIDNFILNEFNDEMKLKFWPPLLFNKYEKVIEYSIEMKTKERTESIKDKKEIKNKINRMKSNSSILNKNNFMIRNNNFNLSEKSFRKNLFINKENDLLNIKKINNHSDIIISKNCIDFMKELLQPQPEKRLGYLNGCKDLMNHSWFHDINWLLLRERRIIPPFIPNNKIANCDSANMDLNDILDEENHFKISKQDEKYFENFNYNIHIINNK